MLARSTLLLTLLSATLLTAWPAQAQLTMLNVGKYARMVNRGDSARNSGQIIVRRDRALQPVLAPSCPNTSAVEIEVYSQATVRDVVLAKVPLNCARWTLRGNTWRYSDPSGTVRSIRYGKSGLRIDVAGPGYAPIAGPVGFLQGQLTIGTTVLRARFHNFERNDAAMVVTRRPSLQAALGEAGFWDVMLADDKTEAHQQDTATLLKRASARDRRDGRSRFLLGMLYLYRFGQQVTRFDDVSPAALSDIRQANTWFAQALPLLWDSATRTGDSRVIGFLGAGEFTQGVVENDPVLRAKGLADLDEAIAVNAFFNVFDLIPVLQAVPANDPLFASTFATVASYLNDPNTLSCVVTQPELCANAGMAPFNVFGSLTLFGDLYIKAGNMQQANTWYSLVAALQTPTNPWPFKSIIDDRVANAAARMALYQDADPTNDPPLIGAGPEACATCHARH